MNGSRQLTTGMVFCGGRKIWIIIPLLLFSHCVYDPMDNRLKVFNNTNKEIYVLIEDNGKSDFGISLYYCNNFFKKYHKDSTFVKPQNLSPGNQERISIKPSQRKQNDCIYFLCADFDSLFAFTKENKEIKDFDDYSIFFYTIKQLDSLDWKVTIDSDSFVPKGATIVKSLPVE